MLEIVGFSFEGTACDGETTPSEDAPNPPYTITKVAAGSEAAKKLQLGDHIVSIDDCPVECLRINSVRTLLNGPCGSTFKMRVRRDQALFSLEMTRKHEEDGANSSPVVSGSVAAPSAVPATSGPGANQSPALSSAGAGMEGVAELEADARVVELEVRRADDLLDDVGKLRSSMTQGPPVQAPAPASIDIDTAPFASSIKCIPAQSTAKAGAEESKAMEHLRTMRNDLASMGVLLAEAECDLARARESCADAVQGAHRVLSSITTPRGPGGTCYGPRGLKSASGKLSYARNSLKESCKVAQGCVDVLRGDLELVVEQARLSGMVIDLPSCRGGRDKGPSAVAEPSWADGILMCVGVKESGAWSFLGQGESAGKEEGQKGFTDRICSSLPPWMFGGKQGSSGGPKTPRPGMGKD